MPEAPMEEVVLPEPIQDAAADEVPKRTPGKAGSYSAEVESRKSTIEKELEKGYRWF